jgi:hypothetical protein
LQISSFPDHESGAIFVHPEDQIAPIENAEDDALLIKMRRALRENSCFAKKARISGSARNEVRAKELVFRPRMDANTRE